MQPPDASLSDKHTIETPEQMPLEFAVAGVGSRFLALAIDTLIQVAVGIGVLIVVASTIGIMATFGHEPSVWMVAALVASIFLLTFGYFTLFEIFWNGQTPGKRKIGIRVIKETGRPLTAAETIGRNFLRIADQLPGFYGVGVLVALLNRNNKRLGDFVAGSIVVRETPFENVRPLWQTGQTEPAPLHQTPFAMAAGGAAGISLDDLALIETFLQRRDSLTPEVRWQMADQILNRIKHKISLDSGGGLSTESILESLAHQRRDTGGYA